MNYTQIIHTAAQKFSRYSAAQCEFAIADIHKTITLWDDIEHNEYLVKLWAELDAARDRLHALKGKTLRQRRSLASTYALIDSL
jgi:hypothetical protein